MARKPIKVPGFNSVGVGQPASCSLQTGPGFTYNNIIGRLTKNGALVTLANLATDVEEIRLEADTEVVRRITPAMMLAHLQSKSLTGLLANGAAAAVASFALLFSDPSRRDVMGEESTQLGTLNVKQLLLVVVLKDPGTAPVYALSAVADVTDDNPKALTIYERHQIDSFDVINGTKVFNTLAVDDDIFAFLLMSNTITAVKVFRDGNTLFDMTKADIEAQLRANAQGELTADYFPVMFDFSRQVTDRLVTAIRDPQNPRLVKARLSDLTFEITATAAATIKALRRTLRY